jgi:uncharacterized Zn finger protein
VADFTPSWHVVAGVIDMEEIAFEIQGSAPEPYRVIFVRRSQTNLSAYCSCPAGENGQYCKHRFAILDGVQKGLVSPNADDMKIVQSWLPGTDVEKALLKMRGLEEMAETIKKELSSAKQELARAMRD